MKDDSTVRQHNGEDRPVVAVSKRAFRHRNRILVVWCLGVLAGLLMLVGYSVHHIHSKFMEARPRGCPVAPMNNGL